jgi:Protein of unknown function (DUF3078)
MSSLFSRSARRLALVLVSLGLGASSSRAASDANTPAGWVLKGVSTLTLQQSAYSANWNGGDRGSWTWVARFDGEAERQWTRSFNLTHQVLLSYGQTSKQELDPANAARRVWAPPSKTNDQIVVDNVARLTLDRALDPYASLRAESQFLDQSQPNATLPVNPIRLKLSAGVSRTLTESADREVTARVGVGGRLTTGRNFIELPPGRRTARYTNRDLGLEGILTANTALLEKRVTYKGRLSLFQPLVYSQRELLERYDALVGAVDPTHRPIADDWRTINVDLDNVFTGRITSALAVELAARLVYIKFDTAASLDTTQPLAVLVPQVERNVRRAGQYRQTLALALSYRLF